MISFDSRTRSLTLSSERYAIGPWSLSVEVDGRVLSAAEAEAEVVRDTPLEVRLSFAQAGITWRLRATAGDGAVLVRSTLTNETDRPISLGKVCLLEAPEGLDVAGPQDELLCLPLAGAISDRPVYRVADPACPRASKIKLQLFNRTRGLAAQIGFVSFGRANTEVEHDWDAERGLTGVRAWCDFAGWRLPPGETTDTEELIVAVGDDPHAQLVRWAELAAERCAPRRWEEAPIGWVGWSWVDSFTVERYEDVVLRNAAAIRRRLAGFGVNYIWVSLGNIARVCPGDWLSWNHELFPGGPEYLAARLRELDFRWGLWCGAFWVCTLAEDVVEELADALLRGPDGSPMVVRPEWQYGDAGLMPKQQRPCIYALDPSHPKSLALLRDVFSTYRRWGVRYYMIDFLEAAAGNIGPYPYEQHHDTGLVAGPEVYHNALRVIREAAGDDTYFLTSSGPTVHNAGFADAIRTGNDFGEGRALYPDSYFYPATFVINSSSYWTGARRALTNQASAWYTHRRLYINDSGNVLTVDSPLSVRDAQIHATIHAMSGGPSMIGDDVDRMDEERLALIKKTLPRPRDVAVPVDLFDSPHPERPKVFHRRVAKPWGRFDVVAVYNFGDELLRLPVPVARLGLPDDREFLVWEFWNGEYVGAVQGSLEATVPPGSVRVYRLTAAEGRPALLGTDMHLLMGEVEVLDCAWDPDRLTLSGRALRPAGETGGIFLHAPAGLRVADPEGLWIAKDARDESLIVKLRLSFENGPADWSVRFAPVAAGAARSEAELA